MPIKGAACPESLITAEQEETEFKKTNKHKTYAWLLLCCGLSFLFSFYHYDY